MVHAMRAIHLESRFLELAEDVVQHVFRENSLLPHLLTRHYARGIVEYAKTTRMVSSNAYPEATPPYGSEWPAIKIPSARKVDAWCRWADEPTPEEAARRSLCYSVADETSDFSRYVIGDLSDWSSIRITRIPPKTAKQKYEAFRDGLRGQSRNAFEALEVVHRDSAIVSVVDLIRRVKDAKGRETNKKLAAAVSEAKSYFLKTIRNDPKRAQIFREFVWPYFAGLRGSQLEHVFDAKIARRWMVQRIFDYGWTGERFAWFDRYIKEQGRAAHKAERIGKKYQWIAYFELLARLADNFYLRKDRWADEGYERFNGIWEIGYGRNFDIDLAITLQKTRPSKFYSTRSWWSPIHYTAS